MNITTDFRRSARAVCGRLEALLRRGLAIWILGSMPFYGSSAQAQQAAPATAMEPLAAIRSAAQSHVKAELASSPGESIVTAAELDGRLHLARCSAPLKASLPPGLSLQARVTIAVTCAGPVHWTLYVPVTIESRIAVLILKRPVARETRLTPADVTIETRTAAGPGNAYLTTLADLNGRVVKRPLAAGTTLAVEMFVPDLIVRHGQQVTLLAAAGGMEVRAAGRALTDGAAGARVQVQNLSSLRVIEGVVESPDVVRVAN